MTAGGCQGMYKYSPFFVLAKIEKNHTLWQDHGLLTVDICSASPNLILSIKI